MTDVSKQILLGNPDFFPIKPADYGKFMVLSLGTGSAMPTSSASPDLDVASTHFRSAGIIQLYAGAVDVAVEANQQHYTAGIALWSLYADRIDTTNSNNNYAAQTPQYFVDVRGNAIIGQCREDSEAPFEDMAPAPAP